MHAGAHLDAERLHGLHDRVGALDGPGGAVEGREEAVAGGVHLGAAVAAEQRAHRRVVALDQVAPALVSQPGGGLGGADDVGEHDGGQHAVEHRLLVAHRPHETLDLAGDAVLVAEVRHVLVALERDVLGAGNVLGQVAVVLGAVPFAVQDQGGHVDGGQHVPHVVLVDHALVGDGRARTHAIARELCLPRHHRRIVRHCRVPLACELLSSPQPVDQAQLLLVTLAGDAPGIVRRPRRARA